MTSSTSPVCLQNTLHIIAIRGIRSPLRGSPFQTQRNQCIIVINEKEDVDSYFSRVSIHQFDFRKQDVFIPAERYLLERAFLVEKEPEPVVALPAPVVPIKTTSATIGFSGELES